MVFEKKTKPRDILMFLIGQRLLLVNTLCVIKRVRRLEHFCQVTTLYELELEKNLAHFISWCNFKSKFIQIIHYKYIYIYT